VVTLPNPEAPPDENADEPVVELGTVEIPRIGVTKSIYEGITLSTLDHGPGHWPGTAMPGAQGNVVVAGHRVSHDKPFRYLDRLAPGDDVIFTTDAGRFVYKVTATEVVGPEALWIVDQTAEFTGTLFACHPPGSTRQRIVVHLAFAPNGSRAKRASEGGRSTRVAR
jgi:sortase A